MTSKTFYALGRGDFNKFFNRVTNSFYLYLFSWKQKIRSQSKNSE